MGKLSVRLAFVFLLFAVVSRAVELIGESDAKPGSTAVSETTPTTTTVELPPLTLIRFRHVNRRFPRGPLPLTFRRGKPCRGLHRRRRDNDISYGNDMIVSSSSSSDHGRQIPIRWSDLRHVEPGFEGPLHRPHRHRLHRHDHDGEDRLFEHHHHRHHEHENGFLMGLRKFLGHF